MPRYRAQYVQEVVYEAYFSADDIDEAFERAGQLPDSAFAAVYENYQEESFDVEEIEEEET